MLNALLTLAAGGPDQHVYNHPFFKNESGMWIWSGIMGNLVLSALILIVGGLWVASKVKTGPESQGTDRYITKNRLAHMIEVICVYLREEIVRPLLKDRTDKLMPILWSIFFILVNNILGLIPFLDILHLINKDWADRGVTPLGGTATQSIWVTGAMALIAAIIFNGAAIFRLGIGGFVKHMWGELPWYMAPISLLLLVIESVGQFIIKPVALAIRLFANMTAGHILMATLFMFVAQVWNQSILLKAPVTVISVAGAVAINFLELFVAFLQAFIFMFLTAVFISIMDHHDEHGHEHEHDHAHGHEHAHA